MEAYTINEVPLAGHAILFGRGQSVQTLDTSAVPSLRICGRPVAASMSMTSEADGVLALTGRGEASMSMSAAARAYLLICGVGDAAVMVLSALADGRVIPVARGVADMTLSAVAEGTMALLAKGTALLHLDAPARGTIATRATGQADMEMSGAAGIPRPIKLPAKFAHAHPSRQVRVDHAWSTRQVEPENRTVTIEQGGSIERV